MNKHGKLAATLIASGIALTTIGVGTSDAQTLPARSGGTTVYVYTDSHNPRVIARLCREAQAEWGPADRCRVLPARYADTSVGEAAGVARGGW